MIKQLNWTCLRSGKPLDNASHIVHHHDTSHCFQPQVQSHTLTCYAISPGFKYTGTILYSTSLLPALSFGLNVLKTANRPIGSMYVPDMAYTAAGPITSAARNFVRIAFSEPIIGLDIAQFNVTLKASPDATTASAKTSSRKLMQVFTKLLYSSPASSIWASKARPHIKS